MNVNSDQKACGGLVVAPKKIFKSGDYQFRRVFGKKLGVDMD